MNTAPPLPHYTPGVKRSFFARGWVRLLLLAIVGIGIWQMFDVRPTTKPTNAQAVLVKVAIASMKHVPLTIQAVGNVVPYQSVAVRARLDSQVTAVHFKDGDEVHKGDLLFELDDKSLRAQAAQLEANIARDRATLENARRQSTRAATLADKGFATKATQDDSAANVAVAHASLNASIAALDSVKVQLGYTRITAPITGRTGTINVTLGNNVKANDTQPLVTINQLKPIRVQTALPQQYFDRVRSAMQTGTVSVSVAMKDDAASSVVATGVLDYVDNAVDATTSTFVTRAGFANEDERLLPGMFVTARMTLGGDEEALSVPEVAIQRGQAGDYVFVVNGDKAMKREVTVSRLQNGIAIIAKGLEAGTTVVTDGLLGLKDGSTVTVANDTPAEVAPAAAKPAEAK